MEINIEYLSEQDLRSLIKQFQSNAKTTTQCEKAIEIFSCYTLTIDYLFAWLAILQKSQWDHAENSQSFINLIIRLELSYVNTREEYLQGHDDDFINFGQWLLDKKQYYTLQKDIDMIQSVSKTFLHLDHQRVIYDEEKVKALIQQYKDSTHTTYQCSRTILEKFGSFLTPGEAIEWMLILIKSQWDMGLNSHLFLETIDKIETSVGDCEPVLNLFRYTVFKHFAYWVMNKKQYYTTKKYIDYIIDLSEIFDAYYDAPE